MLTFYIDSETTKMLQELLLELVRHGFLVTTIYQQYCFVYVGHNKSLQMLFGPPGSCTYDIQPVTTITVAFVSQTISVSSRFYQQLLFQLVLFLMYYFIPCVLNQELLFCDSVILDCFLSNATTLLLICRFEQFSRGGRFHHQFCGTCLLQGVYVYPLDAEGQC